MRASGALNRRTFLSVVAASAGAFGASVPELLRERHTGTQRSIRVGMLGAQHPHAEEKLNVLRASPEYELVGVCEGSEAVRATWEKQGVKVLSQESLLEQCEVVVVESPVRDHARHALLALQADKHVHLEKPPAATMGDLRKMVALANRKRRLLQVGYMWRYHPGFQKIFEAVRQGWLGDIFQVRGSISNQLATQRRPQWAEFKGGALFELGSHLVDAVVRLLGRPKEVTPFLRRHGHPSDDLKDNNVVVLEYDRALAVITNAAIEPAAVTRRGFEVFGSNGAATLRPIEPPALEFELVHAAGPYQQGRQKVELPDYRRYEADFAELALAVRRGHRLPVPPEIELSVQETLLRASQML